MKNHEAAKRLLQSIESVLLDNNDETVTLDLDEGFVRYTPEGHCFKIDITDADNLLPMTKKTNTAGTRKYARFLAGLMMTHGYEVSMRAHDCAFQIDGMTIFMIDQTPGATHEPKISIESAVINCGEYEIRLGGDSFQHSGIIKDGQMVLLNATPKDILTEFRRLGVPLSNSIQFILGSLAVQKG